MKYIKIDNNRKQIAQYSGYAGRNTPDTIKVDCLAPDKYHKLKTDYQNFTGLAQWEVDLAPYKADKLEQFRQIPKDYIYSKYDDGEQLSLLKRKVDGTETQKAMVNQIDNWISQVLADYYDRRELIQTATTLEAIEAVSWDFTNNDASKPSIELSDILQAG